MVAVLQEAPAVAAVVTDARGAIRREIRARIKFGGDAPTISEAMANRLRADAALLEAFWRQALDAIVYVETMSVAASTRSLLRGGFRPALVDDLDVRSQAQVNQWNNWLEHSGDRYILLLDMTAGDLAVAMTERGKRVAAETRVIALHRALIAGLDDDQRVRDRFTAVDIERIWQGLAQEE